MRNERNILIGLLFLAMISRMSGILGTAISVGSILAAIVIIYRSLVLLKDDKKLMRINIVVGMALMVISIIRIFG